MMKLPGIDLGEWVTVKDGHLQFAALYRRHYSCYRYADRRRNHPGYRNRNLVMGPGEKMALITPDGTAALGWRKFIDDSGQTGVNCAFFRNEGERLSSQLILAGEHLAWKRWPNLRLYTYINPLAIRSTNPGYCFQMAGWVKCGKTKGGLVILEKLKGLGGNDETHH